MHSIVECLSLKSNNQTKQLVKQWENRWYCNDSHDWPISINKIYYFDSHSYSDLTKQWRILSISNEVSFRPLLKSIYGAARYTKLFAFSDTTGNLYWVTGIVSIKRRWFLNKLHIQKIYDSQRNQTLDQKKNETRTQQTQAHF